MKAKTNTFLASLLIAAVPLGLLWKENASLRAQTAAQSLTAPAPAAGEPPKSGRRGPLLVPRPDNCFYPVNCFVYPRD